MSRSKPSKPPAKTWNSRCPAPCANRPEAPARLPSAGVRIIYCAMKDIPRSALVLGFAGLLPFLWGAVTVLLPDVGMQWMTRLGGRFIGPYIQIAYGTV